MCVEEEVEAEKKITEASTPPGGAVATETPQQVWSHAQRTVTCSDVAARTDRTADAAQELQVEERQEGRCEEPCSRGEKVKVELCFISVRRT